MRKRGNALFLFLALTVLAALALPVTPVFGAEKKKSPTPKKKAAAPKKAEEAAPDKLPWSLREHYTYTEGNLHVDYCKVNAEWRIRVKSEVVDIQNPEVLVRDVGFSIELGDGRVLRHDELGRRETVMSRDKYTSEEALGGGTHYSVQFAPVDGLSVNHRFDTFEQWPFLSMNITLRNDSPSPVTVKKVVCAAFGPGSISGLSADTQVRRRFIEVRGGFPVFAKDAPPANVLFHDPAKGFDFGFGVLPSGRSRSGVDLQSSGGAWQGSIVCDYAPGLVLQPGETLAADPVWVTYGRISAQQDLQYSWAMNSLKWPAKPENGPRAWVTVPDTEDFAALKALAQDAMANGIFHALIPSHWEGRPGSLEGAAPRYPKDIGKAARELRNQGGTPGITVDPLCVDGGGAFTAKSADGRTWANPATPEGAEFIRKRMAGLVGGGFGFVVVEPSGVPDEVLAQFGVSRMEADWRAIGAVCAAAAGKAAVYPAAATTLKAERDAWLEAAAAGSRMSTYGVALAPVRFQADGLSALDEETMAAIRLWQGPVEVLGRPASGGRAKLAEALKAPVIKGKAQDAHLQSPLLWSVKLHSPAVGSMGSSLLAFSGAPAWKCGSVEAGDNETALFAWRPEGGKVVVPENGEIPPSARFTTYGLCPKLERPTFMGVSKGYTFGLDKVTELSWNGDKGVLTCTVAAPLDGDTQAYVALTPGWKVKSVKAGGGKVRYAADDKWVVFPAADGKYELQFEQAK